MNKTVKWILIIVVVIIAIAIIGYNYWGWFSRSTTRTSNNSQINSSNDAGSRTISQDSKKHQVYDIFNKGNSAVSKPKQCWHNSFIDTKRGINYNLTFWSNNCQDIQLLKAIDISNKYLNSITTACNRPSHIVSEFVAKLESEIKFPIDFTGQMQIDCDACFNGTLKYCD